MAKASDYHANLRAAALAESALALPPPAVSLKLYREMANV